MKKSQRVLSLFIALCLMAGIAVGCGSTETADKSTGTSVESSTAAVSSDAAPALKKVPITIMVAGDRPKQQNEVLANIDKITEKDLNINLKVNYIPWGDYINQVKLKSAAGEEFDIYLSFFSEIAGSIARKQAIPINDLLDKHGAALKEKIPQSLWDTLTVDGKIYGVPSVYPMTELERGFLVRKDLRLKYNLPEITDVATMEKFFEAITANEKDMVACGSWGLRGSEFEKDSVGHSLYLLGSGQVRFMYINQDVTPLKVENYYKTDAFKKSWELNVKAYKNGWIPKDALSDNDWGGMFISGKAASTMGDLYMINDYTNQLKKNVPQAEVEMAIFNKDGEWQDVNPCNNFGMISSTSKNPDRAMMFLNWLHASQENYDAYMLGIEGVTYVLEGKKAAVPAGTDPKDKFAPTPWFTMFQPFARMWTTDSPAYIETVEFWNSLKPKATPLQTFQYSTENVKAEVAAVEKVCTDIGRPLHAGILSTQADYDKFIEALEKAGIQKIIDDTQKQVDEFMAK